MQPSSRDLLLKLSVGPNFLLLGQASAALESGFDTIVAQAARAARLSIPDLTLTAAQTLDSESRKALYSAIAQLPRTDPPSWLREVARFPWNGVFTSRIDGNIARAFDAEWRRAVPTSAITKTRHPRNISQLRIWMLFGGVSLPDEEQPPLDLLEMATRKRAASEALSQLATTFVTPRGTLLIEGYDTGDWLTPEDIFALVSQFAPGQVHLFSANDKLLANMYVKAAVDRGYLAAHSSSLALFLSDAESSGRLIRPAVSFSTSAKFIRLRDSLVEINRDTWNSVIATGRPVDRDLLQPYGHVSNPIEYQNFRNFLGASEGAPAWQAIASSYNFVRDFEEDLYNRVKDDLQSARVPEPLIVSGQAATGKTTALCALALRVARTGAAAVLHISRRGDRPSVAAIDNFAQWAEENGAPATLIVWDGMTEADEYFNTYLQLRARGRRALIVGSTYLEQTNSDRVIEAPATLSPGETNRIFLWLARYGVAAPRPGTTTILDSFFLVLLYRLLPETRRGLQRGLTLELRSAEAGMEKQARKSSENAKRLGSMAEALQRAGITIETFLPASREEAELHELSFVERSTAEQLTALVLIGGRHGLRIPLELALRILGRDGSTTLVDVIKRYDIIRWSEDESGEQYLGSRTAFEANLLARGDISSPKAEVGVITVMISELQPRATGGGGPEVQFIVDLLSRIGPQSEESRRFVPYYLDLIEAFRELRETPGRSHHRLVLIETNLTREYVQWSQAGESTSTEQRLALLRSAQAILEETLDTSGVSGRARLNLLVELASTLGTQIYEISASDQAPNTKEIAGLTNRVIETTLEARSYGPENYYPVDVLAWVCMRVADKTSLPDAQLVDLVADTIASLESLDPDELSPKQRARYDDRWVQFGRLLNNPLLESKHLEQLRSNQDPSAFYLLARREAQLRGATWDPAGAMAGLQLLLDAPENVREDWRCARLILDLFWLTRTGKRFLRGERETLAFSTSDWQESLRILESISMTSVFDSYRMEFLRALALFHLERYKASAAAFEELDRMTANLSTRVIATYLASTADGRPATFTGQVRSVTRDGRRGKVWVDELGIELPFIPYRFSGADSMQRGDPLPEFYIEFNMRGPYAYPVRSTPSRSSAHSNE